MKFSIDGTKIIPSAYDNRIKIWDVNAGTCVYTFAVEANCDYVGACSGDGQKIVINSAYGVLGTGGLNFNSFHNADRVTAKGREILTIGINWAHQKGFTIVNVDTDAFSYCKTDLTLSLEKYNVQTTIKDRWEEKFERGEVTRKDANKKATKELYETFNWNGVKGKKLVKITPEQAAKKGVEPRDEFQEHINEINSLYKDGIIWEDDGYYPKFLVVKAKNYVLINGKKKVKIQGSALKATMKEKRLKNFIDCVIMLLMNGKKDHIFHLYLEYANEIKSGILDIEDMEGWAMKKTVTKAVLNPERAQEQKVFDALQGTDYQEGDKRFFYSQDEDTLKLIDQFDGNYDRDTYYNKLYKTLVVFETLFDVNIFPNFRTGRNRNLI